MAQTKRRYRYRKPKGERQCVACGKEFRTYSGTRKYCSGACRTWALRWRRERTVEGENVYQCTSCGEEQEKTEFENDLLEVAEVDYIEQLDTLPSWAMNEAADDFGGSASSLCAPCYWECRVAAVEIIAAEEAD